MIWCFYVTRLLSDSRKMVFFVAELSKYIPEGKRLDPMTFQSVMDAANAKYYLARVRKSLFSVVYWCRLWDSCSHFSHVIIRMSWRKCPDKLSTIWIGTVFDQACQTSKRPCECNKWSSRRFGIFYSLSVCPSSTFASRACYTAATHKFLY